MSDATDISQESPYAMSDEEFMAQPIPDFTDEEVTTDEADISETEEVSEGTVETESEDDSDQNSSDDSAQEDSSTGDETDDESVESEDDTDDDSTSSDAEDDTEDDTTESNSDDTDDGTSDEVDYAAEHAKLLAPFKANGIELKVDSTDEAIRLMQMGANYQKKMTAIKPSLNLLKMLESQGLLEEDKLNFLIDVSKGDKNAIRQLLEDTKLDVDDLDSEEPNDYTPTSYRISKAEQDLTDVLESIQDSPSYEPTLKAINTDMDETSRDLLANSPEAIRTIHDHIEAGYYSQIVSEVAKQKLLGRVPNTMSDIEAYRQVGDMMHEAGQLVTAETKPKPKASTVNHPSKSSNSRSTKKRTQRRRAASSASSRSTSAKSAVDGLNPLAMSDEEFLKITSNY